MKRIMQAISYFYQEIKPFSRKEEIAVSNDEIKEEVRRVKKNVEEIKKITEELKKTTAYKIAKSTGNL